MVSTTLLESSHRPLWRCEEQWMADRYSVHLSHMDLSHLLSNIGSCCFTDKSNQRKLNAICSLCLISLTAGSVGVHQSEVQNEEEKL